ncbi:MAG: hypothetical protein OXG27_15690 [Chloroflexi bacterium]|nr:hypothetical protein [Chloroflexota bacterium]
MSVNDQESGSARRPGLDASLQPHALAHADAVVAADLDATGHAGHLVLLQRLVPSSADPDERRALFWCESCKLWLLVLIGEPGER